MVFHRIIRAYDLKKFLMSASFIFYISSMLTFIVFINILKNQECDSQFNIFISMLDVEINGMTATFSEDTNPGGRASFLDERIRIQEKEGQIGMMNLT